jgi:pimeloyl-ACP methyl ester carboxylesterase
LQEIVVETGGLKFACRRWGDPSAPAIILIRGLGTQMIEWSPRLVEALVAGGLQVIAFDNRDVGLSGKLDASYSLQDMAADVVGILSELNIDRAHVFGISLGGMVAQLVALHYPERVRCLFSVMSSSGNPQLPTAAPEVRQKMLEQASGREAIIALDAQNRALFGSPGYPESLETRMEMATRAYDRCYYPEGVARQYEAAMGDGSRVTRLQQIAVPTLVIHGADDPLLPVQGGEDTARQIPGAQLQIVAGMGHNIPDSLAPDIAARVLTFVAGHC